MVTIKSQQNLVKSILLTFSLELEKEPNA